VFVRPGNALEYALRFPGHIYDPDLRLHYNRFRDYDPWLGRYLQPDPLGCAGGVNLYAYPSNPLVDVDVLGLQHPPRDTDPPDSNDGQSRPRNEDAEGDGTPPPRRPLEEMSDAELRDHCEARAQALQAAFEAAHPRASRAVTLSVGVVDGPGGRRVVVTTSADSQRVPRAVRRAMEPGETVRSTPPRLRRRRSANPNFDPDQPAHPTRNPRTRSRTVEVDDNGDTRPYQRASRGEPVEGSRHHAEQRMNTGADQNGETVRAQAPTRRCCPACREVLGEDGLARVPEGLRGGD
jgi:RHS repeat-associated protein